MQIKCSKCDNLIDFNIEEKSQESDMIPEFSIKKLYINSEIGLRMRSTPEIRSDNILGVLKFGQEISVLKEQEKWFEIECLDKKGWVSCYFLTEENPVQERENQIITKKETLSDLLPDFKTGIANLASDSNTLKLRKIIKDEFGGGVNNWDLQCTEYVQYKVQQIGITIQWPSERPRHGGKWSKIFERSGMYKVLNTPKAGCAMSFTSGLRNSNVGHVAFIEEIFDNWSIKISEANWPPPGKYWERILIKSQWQDKYKGRFIDFT